MQSPSLAHSARRLRNIDVRMIVAVPALVVLLAIGMGVANYWVFLDMADYVAREAPNLDTTLYHRRVLAVLLVFALLAAVSGAVLVYTVLRPLRALTQAVADIASGRLSEAVEIPPGMFEVDQLGKTFNSMVGFINSVIQEREDILSEWSQGGSMIVDLQGRVNSVNEEGRKILDIEEGALGGRTLEELEGQAPPAAAGLLDYARRCVQSPQAREACEIPATSPGQAPLRASCTSLQDYGHGPTALLIHFHDAQLVRSLNRLFSRTDHLAALGTFTVGLSHELRNPLATLKGNAQLLGNQVGPESPYLAYVERMVAEIDRLDRLVRELYDYSRIPVDQSEAFDLNALALEALNEVRQGLGDRATANRRVELALAPDLRPVFGQTQRIRRALGNIVQNAYEHTPEGKSLTLKTRNASEPFPHCVVIEIANTGSSVAEENRERIFEPFFSTRPGGTGLGLAIAYQIVAQNRGALSLATGDDSVCLRMALRAAPSALDKENAP